MDCDNARIRRVVQKMRNISGSLKPMQGKYAKGSQQ